MPIHQFQKDVCSGVTRWAVVVTMSLSLVLDNKASTCATFCALDTILKLLKQSVYQHLNCVRTGVLIAGVSPLLVSSQNGGETDPVVLQPVVAVVTV
jgi:hypothetical protein